MTDIQTILSDTAHRPYPIPKGRWQYYQEWNDVLFLHYKVPYNLLRAIVPKQLALDTFNDDVYLSIVPFTMQNIRPRNLPAIQSISDFHEINVRTYVSMNDKQGVYFLNIEAQKHISTFIAHFLSGLPYEKAKIRRGLGFYRSINNNKAFHLSTDFEIENQLMQKTALDLWLTERYCLYLTGKTKVYRYDIHHQEWAIQNVRIEKLDQQYKFGELNLSDQLPALAHYSKGVKVLAWAKAVL